MSFFVIHDSILNILLCFFSLFYDVIDKLIEEIFSRLIDNENDL